MKTVIWRWFLWTGMTLGTLAPLAAGPAGVEFLGLAALPGGDRAPADQSGLAHTLLEDGVSYQDRFDGFGSGLAWTGKGDRYLLLSDRGPNKVQYPGGAAVDFTTNYPNRFQVADIRVTRGAQGWKVEVVQTGTRLLKTEDGTPFTGLSTAFTSSDATKNLRLDSEGIRVAPDGTVWISDEYGPVVYHFAKDGRRIGTLPVPGSFLIDHPAATLTQEMDPTANPKGRYTNRGAEGLALAPDGTRMVVAMQSPLVQDGGLKGTNTRFLVYDLTHPTQAPKQYVYRQDSTKTANSEILALNSHQFLVDERDSNPGPQGVKLLYLIDLDQDPAPTEVSSVDKLDGKADVVVLKKTLFADLGTLLNASATFASPAGLPDKIEGIAFGPDLPDGRHLLLATNDNDYATTFPNYVFAFAVDPSVVPGFRNMKIEGTSPW